MREVRSRVRVVEHVDARRGARRVARGAASASPSAARVDTLACDTLLLHQGVVPHAQLRRSPPAATSRGTTRSCCFEPVVDDVGRIVAAGPVDRRRRRGRRRRRRGGAARRARGARRPRTRSAGSTRTSATARRVRIARALARAMRGRAFLDALYRPADAFRRARRRHASRAAARRSPPRRVVEAARGGRGRAQPGRRRSRVAAWDPARAATARATVTALLVATTCGVPPAEVGTYRQRFPIRPVTLGEIASLPGSPAADEAVVRQGERH